MSTIADAITQGDIKRCYEVMSQLRSSASPDAFYTQVERQQASGYVLSYLEDGGAVVGVAGWRMRENLALGKHLYVEDLVVDETLRSKGYGTVLVDYLVQRGTDLGCAILMLDSGVQRYSAHRFYLRERFDIRAYLCSSAPLLRARSVGPAVDDRSYHMLGLRRTWRLT